MIEPKEVMTRARTLLPQAFNASDGSVLGAVLGAVTYAMTDAVNAEMAAHRQWVRDLLATIGALAFIVGFLYWIVS